MTPFKKFLLGLAFIAGFCLLQFISPAQRRDTIPKKTLTEYLRNRKGILVKVVKSFMRNDSTEVEKVNNLKRNDVPFLAFEGYIIRKITLNELPFGIPISDTVKKTTTSLTRLANNLHHTTRPWVIRKNLFFKKNQILQPYLMADNVRFLRQLPFIQDVSFDVQPVVGTDSIDVVVNVKDIFSISGSLGSLGLKRSDIELREDNFGGSGNALAFQGLFDNERENNFGVGVAYLQRNIAGSFINGEIGYKSFYPAIDGPKEENQYYFNFLKPLANRYMRWTYELNGSYHSTRNMYDKDSVYYTNNRYEYYNIEAWAGYNINSKGYTIREENKELRKLVGLRIIDRQFQNIPNKYSEQYYWKYANLTGVLASLTFYRQNFYRTQYIYGFGRSEDIPEGLNLTVTAGYTKKQNRLRSFIGFNYERSYFNAKKNYISYTIRAEGNLRRTSVEDINLLGAIAYFDHLKSVGPRWKQRFFLNLDVAQQVNNILNEPLFLESKFGLPEFRNDRIGGTLRATVKAESVFFSPWSLASFRFAPFIFGNLSVFSPYSSETNVYTSIGGGLRIRNESLVFGTLELKGYYFPRKNFRNESFRFDLSTDIRFKYDQQLVRRPDFIRIN